jgi:hypothetical protein
MTDFVNLQVYGVPIATFGLVGITTAILAYTTATSGIQNAVETLTDVTTNPVGALSDMNPLAPSESVSKEEEPLTTFESAFKEEEEEPNRSEEVRGGKRRRRKTPKRKNPKNKSSNKKHKK